jgi:Short C-terminal domain
LVVAMFSYSFFYMYVVNPLLFSGLGFGRAIGLLLLLLAVIPVIWMVRKDQRTDGGTSKTPPPSQSSRTGSKLDELEKLAALRDKGIITEEEFNAKKEQLLDL